MHQVSSTFPTLFSLYRDIFHFQLLKYTYHFKENNKGKSECFHCSQAMPDNLLQGSNTIHSTNDHQQQYIFTLAQPKFISVLIVIARTQGSGSSGIPAFLPLPKNRSYSILHIFRFRICHVIQ